MPRVPSFVPRVGLAAGQGPGVAAPGVEPLRDQTGRELQGLGQGAMSFGYGLSRVGEHMYDEHVETKLREKDNRLQEVVRQRLEGQEGYLRKLGKSAVGEEGEVREQVLDDLRNDFEALTGDLSPYEREAFARVAMSRWQTAVGRVDEHEAKQQRAWSIGESEARIKSLGDQAYAALGTDDWDVYFGAMRNEVDARADLEGMAPDSVERNNLVLEAGTQLHSRAIAHLAQTDPKAAEKHLNRAEERGELRPGAEKDLREIVERATTSDTSLRLSMDMVGKHRTADGGVDLAAAESQLGEQFRAGEITAQVYDATLERLGRADRIGREMQARDLNAAVDQATAFLSQNPLLGVADLPPDLYVRLQKSGAIDTVNRFADGGRYSTDPQAFYEAMQLPADALRRVSQAEVWRQFRGRLADPELNKVMARHAAANQRADNEQTFLLSVQDRLDNATNKMLGIAPGRSMTEDQRDRKFRLTQKLEERLQQYEEKVLGGSRKANPKEFQEILDRAALDTVSVDEDWGVDPVEPILVAELTPGRVEKAYLSVGNETVYGRRIPSKSTLAPDAEPVYETISEQLSKNGGQIPTERQVVEFWVRLGKPRSVAEMGAAMERLMREEQRRQISGAAGSQTAPASVDDPAIFGVRATDPRRPPGGMPSSGGNR